MEHDQDDGFITPDDKLMTSGEVAQIFRVDPKTVTRWAAGGKIESVTTPGGHHRYREKDVRAFMKTTARKGKAK
jgi:excisionase family DNA binding protein